MSTRRARSGINGHGAANGHANGQPPEFPISSGIPIPRKRKPRKAFPFDRLEIGDSFFVPGELPKTMSAARYAAQVETGHVFATRTVVEQETGGVRVWRTA